MTYRENREQCEAAGYIKVDVDGFDMCGPGGGLCSGHSCPSKKYHNRDHKQPGWYKERALEKTGLKEQYEAEVEGCG